MFLNYEAIAKSDVLVYLDDILCFHVFLLMFLAGHKAFCLSLATLFLSIVGYK